MNKGNIRTLINVLKKSEYFDMSEYYLGGCRTPACIAGHVQDILDVDIFSSFEELVKDFLGVSEEQAEAIVMPRYDYAHFIGFYNRKKKCYEGKITKAHAIRMLERLYATGEVDWKASKEDPKVNKHEKFDMADWLNKLEIEQTPSHLLFEELKQQKEATR